MSMPHAAEVTDVTTSELKDMLYYLERNEYRELSLGATKDEAGSWRAADLALDPVLVLRAMRELQTRRQQDGNALRALLTKGIITKERWAAMTAHLGLPNE